MIDLEALKAKLAEYDDALPRCPQKVARTVNYAPDGLRSSDPTYHDYDLTTHTPCCRPEGHEGECRNSRLILGWPGFVTVSALVAEVERLRAERDHFREAWAAAQVRLDIEQPDYAIMEEAAQWLDQVEAILDGFPVTNPCPPAQQVTALRAEVEHLRSPVRPDEVCAACGCARFRHDEWRADGAYKTKCWGGGYDHDDCGCTRFVRLTHDGRKPWALT